MPALRTEMLPAAVPAEFCALNGSYSGSAESEDHNAQVDSEDSPRASLAVMAVTGIIIWWKKLAGN